MQQQKEIAVDFILASHLVKTPQSLWNITLAKIQNTPLALCPFITYPAPVVLYNSGKEQHCKQA